MARKFKFLRKSKESMIFEGDKMEIYIPKYYLKKGIAVEMGTFIESIGVFPFRVFGKEDKNGFLHNLTLPMPVYFGFTEYYDGDRTLVRGGEEEKYRIFVLQKGDTFIKSVTMEQSGTNLTKFVDLLHKGKLPSIIPYGKLINIYLDNLEINNESLGVPAVTLEYIIAELARYNEDFNTAFRKEIGDPDSDVGENEYSLVNIKELPSLNSTFTDVSFEDINQSMITSVKRKRKGEEEQKSPVEDIIKY